MDKGLPLISRDFSLTVNALAASSASGVSITTLPAGFIVKSISVYAPAMGSGTGLSVGDASDTDRLWLDADTAAATDSQNSTVAPTDRTKGWGYQYDSDTAILLYNPGGSATTASDLTVWVNITGSLDYSDSNYNDQ